MTHQAKKNHQSGMSIGLISHPTKDVSGSIELLVEWRRTHAVRIVALEADARRIGADVEVEVLTSAQFIEEVDLVVALGGDGTMLGAMRTVAGTSIPVLGVNYGNLGFLVEVEPDELTTAIERIIAADYSVEAHHGLDVTVTAGDEEFHFMAFNDVSIARAPGEGMVNADLVVDSTAYGYFTADALVIATPAGSTAYNYAAGGPVLSPAVTAIVLTPVAPMSGIARSVVLGPKEKLGFAIGDSTTRAAIEIDGRVMSSVTAGDSVTISLVEIAAGVVRFDAGRHARKGRLKLSLLDLPLRADQLRELVPLDVRKRELPRILAQDSHKK